jgi:hypothetical protein
VLKDLYEMAYPAQNGFGGFNPAMYAAQRNSGYAPQENNETKIAKEERGNEIRRKGWEESIAELGAKGITVGIIRQVLECYRNKVLLNRMWDVAVDFDGSGRKEKLRAPNTFHIAQSLNTIDAIECEGEAFAKKARTESSPKS